MTITIKLWKGDCVARLAELESGSIEAVICDPPYDIAFMFQDWDDNNVLRNDNIWCECFRVLKPGGTLKAFAATRTFHRLLKTLTTAGFVDLHLEAHVYGSGFPKSTNISKQLDKSAGVQREIETKPATDDAKLWEGYGTALKPAWEAIVCGKKRCDP